MKEIIERKQIDHLRGVLKSNGYPDWILWDLRDNNNNEQAEERSEEVKEAPLPHHAQRPQQHWWDVRLMKLT